MYNTQQTICRVLKHNKEELYFPVNLNKIEKSNRNQR